jgi:hypothetical protein
MKKVKLLFVIVGIIATSFMIMPMATAVPSGYTLVKADEFNGPSLDLMWQPAYLRHRTTDTNAAARYSFSNGCLVLRIDSNTPVFNSSIDSDMRVSSIQSGEKTGLHKADGANRSVTTFEGYKKQYGYFEVRDKHQAGSGHHVAFWMIGTDPSGGRQTGEIDIHEDAGTSPNSTKLGNLVPWGDSSLSPQDSGVSFDLGNDLTKNFNVYGMEWQPGSLKFYANGVLKRTLNRAPAYPMYILLSLYQGSNWTGSIDNSIPYPKQYTIDYLRIYDKTGVSTPTPSRSTTPTPTSPPSSGMIYPAENASYGGGAKTETTNGGFHGGGYINFPTTGGYLQFSNVYGGPGGSITLKFRYALASGTRTGRIQINGGAWQNITFSATGAWTAWGVYSYTVTLNSGSANTIRLESTGQDLANIDELEI